jgi:hypothetical protein
MARLSALSRPMNPKFSGSAASTAPRRAASDSNRPAASRLASMSCPEVIWIAATFTRLLYCENAGFDLHILTYAAASAAISDVARSA